MKLFSLSAVVLAVVVVACSSPAVQPVDTQPADTADAIDSDVPHDTTVADTGRDTVVNDLVLPDGVVDVPGDVNVDGGSDTVLPDVVDPVDVPDGTDIGGTDVTGDVGGDVQDDVSVPVPGLVVNEVVAKAVLSGPDWVELLNIGDVRIDLTGWTFRDENDDALHTFEFVVGTTIEPGAFLLLEGRGGTGLHVFNFGFGNADQVRIFDADGNLVTSASWLDGEALEGFSWGRYPDGSGDFATLPTPTKGTPNVSPL
jgi:hypothetical protein